MNSNTVEAFGVVDANGILIKKSIAPTQSWAKDQIETLARPWENLKAKGYRVVRVTCTLK